MATTIKSIPVLKEADAEGFVVKAQASLAKRATVNFSKQVQTTHSILKKANMR